MNTIAKYAAALVMGLGLIGFVGCEDPGDDHDHGEDQGPAAPPPTATQPTNQ